MCFCMSCNYRQPALKENYLFCERFSFASARNRKRENHFIVDSPNILIHHRSSFISLKSFAFRVKISGRRKGDHIKTSDSIQSLKLQMQQKNPIIFFRTFIAASFWHIFSFVGSHRWCICMGKMYVCCAKVIFEWGSTTSLLAWGKYGACGLSLMKISHHK